MTDLPRADFSRFGPRAAAAVIGASGGIGAALTEQLAQAPGIGRVYAFSRSGDAPAGPRIDPGRLDLEDEARIAAAAAGIGTAGNLRIVIVAAGLLHGRDHQPEKAWRDLSPGGFSRSFAVNTTGPALVAKHFLPLMPRRGAGIFAALSARVGSISDNQAGGWYSYRASKAALNQVLKCLAIEEARRRPGLVVAGLQPGTVDTALSKPFQGAVREGGLFTAAFSAAHLLRVLAALQPAQSGGLFDWQGQEIAP
ncbi:MAG: SDR family NAD(P)-dependent oxidoreductase [Pseudomonadota bacterium]